MKVSNNYMHGYSEQYVVRYREMNADEDGFYDFSIKEMKFYSASKGAHEVVKRYFTRLMSGVKFDIIGITML